MAEFPISSGFVEVERDKGGRPDGASDKTKSGKRNRPRQTEKARVVASAVEWHVANAVADIEVTVAEYFSKYSKGMTASRRYFKARLIEGISKLSQ
jgi:hypothetical protein